MPNPFNDDEIREHRKRAFIPKNCCVGAGLTHIDYRRFLDTIAADRKQNAELKTLLRECLFGFSHNIGGGWKDDIIAKIDKALEE